MAAELSAVNDPVSAPPFLEVVCKISGKKNRFASGTTAGFAVSVINRKLDSVESRAIYIESVKEGEEPISFGPDAVLVDYGSGWKLQTVTEVDYSGTKNEEGFHGLIPPQIPAVKLHVAHVRRGQEVLRCLTFLGSDGARLERRTKPKPEPESAISLVYIGKILFAFVLMFVLGAVFTIALENLPRLILYINSSM